MSRTWGHGTAGQPVTGPGRDWWGKRPLSGLSVSRRKGMKWAKRVLHAKERRLEGKLGSKHDYRRLMELEAEADLAILSGDLGEPLSTDEVKDRLARLRREEAP